MEPPILINASVLTISTDDLFSSNWVVEMDCPNVELRYDTEIHVSKALPSLQEIDIDYCYDLDEVCEVVSLKTLSITNCNKLSLLPLAIGNLRLRKLPLEIGKLRKLKKMSMRKCWRSNAMKKLGWSCGKG
ncbi:hypothetical protein Rs2_27304 [Raphanus sativus]|nr:hypothetical protein Rs2_27304 [Raphanus sativus]